MALFRDENPYLGPSTVLKELSGAAGYPIAGDPLYNYYKPTTREILNLTFDGIRNAANLIGWLFIAPWQCQVIAARTIMEVSATATASLQLYKLPYASQPAAPNGTGGVVLFQTAQALSSATATAQTQFIAPLATTAANLILAPGDAMGFVISAAITAVLGGLCQVEIVQLG